MSGRGEGDRGKGGMGLREEVEGIDKGVEGMVERGGADRV